MPPEIFSDCTSLFTLSLHNNPMTAAALRDLKGFNEFDERRRSKYSKQVRDPTLISLFVTVLTCYRLASYDRKMDSHSQDVLTLPVTSAVTLLLQCRWICMSWLHPVALMRAQMQNNGSIGRPNDSVVPAGPFRGR